MWTKIGHYINIVAGQVKPYKSMMEGASFSKLIHIVTPHRLIRNGLSPFEHLWGIIFKFQYFSFLT